MNQARNIVINIFLHKQINCVKVLLFRIILNRDFCGWISYTPHIKHTLILNTPPYVKHPLILNAGHHIKHKGTPPHIKHRVSY